MMWKMVFLLLGIRDDASIMVLFLLMCIWWLLLVICDSVVIGLFCELVYMSIIWLLGRLFIVFRLISMLFGMLR